MKRERRAQWLYDLVRPLAEEVIVCDPRRISTKGNKADELDAERISELLRLGFIEQRLDAID